MHASNTWSASSVPIVLSRSSSSHPVLASLVPLLSPVGATALYSFTWQCTLAASLLSHALSTLFLHPFVSPSSVCIIVDPFQVLCLTLTCPFSDCHLSVSRPTVLHACCDRNVIHHQVFFCNVPSLHHFSPSSLRNGVLSDFPPISQVYPPLFSVAPSHHDYRLTIHGRGVIIP